MLIVLLGLAPELLLMITGLTEVGQYVFSAFVPMYWDILHTKKYNALKLTQFLRIAWDQSVPFRV